MVWRNRAMPVKAGFPVGRMCRLAALARAGEAGGNAACFG